MVDAHGKDAQRHCDEGNASENPITSIRMATMETQKANGGEDMEKNTAGRNTKWYKIVRNIPHVLLVVSR